MCIFDRNGFSREYNANSSQTWTSEGMAKQYGLVNDVTLLSIKIQRTLHILWFTNNKYHGRSRNDQYPYDNIDHARD